MKNFTGKIHGETFEDPALFEAAALGFRAEKKAAAPRGEKADWSVVKGENVDLVRAARGVWKTPKAKAFDPAPGEIGSWVTVEDFGARDGSTIEAQVWSLAPGGAWLATVEGFLFLSNTWRVFAGLPNMTAQVGQVAA